MAFFGFVVCAMLARAFFRWGLPAAEAGLGAAQRAKRYGALRDVVMYIPFLLIIGLTFVAAAIGIAVEDAATSLSAGVRMLLATGVGIIYVANAAIGVRLGRPMRRVMLLFVPGIGLPALACLVSGALAAWWTMVFVALALIALEGVAVWIAHRTSPAYTHSRSVSSAVSTPSQSV